MSELNNYIINTNESEVTPIENNSNRVNISMIELFSWRSGIGAQKRGIDNTNLFNCEIKCVSEVDKEAMIEYAAIHYGLTNEMIESYTEYPSKEEMVNDLISRNIGMDFDKGKMYDWEKLAKKKKGMDLEKY